ncbi:hypothetical protein [Haloechinothrix sp. LS1_15]|uniref:hypothetical protein n=1 Tax=Haloechinothrix sp. LS1_15 TaxID=2652248 RepID=UPI002947C77D|nr:hypothetical protein [Haloechinothrix sp. LS1_15]MDV6012953.1 hypothetical protein [Haloechinothrix sp. LS1_15]
MSIDTKIDGDPESIWSTADWVRDRLAVGIEDSASGALRARNHADSGWDGPASDNFRDQMTTGANKADDFADAARTMARAFDDTAEALKRAQDDMAAIREQAAAAGLSVDGYTIHPPGPAPPDPGSPPQGREATAEAHQAHQRAVAARGDHAAQVEAYEKAQADAEDVRRTWQQAVEDINDTSNDVGAKAWFTVGDIAVGGTAAAAAAAQRVGLLRAARFYQQDAVDAARHVQAYGDHVTDRRGFYQQIDRRDASTRAAANARASASSVMNRWSSYAMRGSGVLAAGGVAYDISQGKNPAQAATSGGAGFAASVGTGALIGTKVGGPVGLVAGTVAGAAVGAVTSGAVDYVWENAGPIRDAVVDGAQEVGEAIGDVGSALKGGVKDAWNAIF